MKGAAQTGIGFDVDQWTIDELEALIEEFKLENSQEKDKSVIQFVFAKPVSEEDWTDDIYELRQVSASFNIPKTKPRSSERLQSICSKTNVI